MLCWAVAIETGTMYRNKNRHSEVETTFAQLEELQRLKCHNFVTEELLKTDINNKKKIKNKNL